MKLQEFLNANGSRKTAEKLMEMRIFKITGLNIQDLPDRTEIWDIVDEIESLLEEQDFDLKTIKSLLSEVTFEFIEEICW
jgi:DNA gyrase/topoisomerase IV subunit A